MSESKIISKTEYTFYWGNQHSSNNTRNTKVDISGDFNGWKKQRMMFVTIASAPHDQNPHKGATHFFKKILDPKTYKFIFHVNGEDVTSQKYDIENDKNWVDLKFLPTKLFIKKTKQINEEKDDNGSDYETCSNFLDQEHDRIIEDHMQDIEIMMKEESSPRIEEYTDSEDEKENTDVFQVNKRTSDVQVKMEKVKGLNLQIDTDSESQSQNDIRHLSSNDSDQSQSLFKIARDIKLTKQNTLMLDDIKQNSLKINMPDQNISNIENHVPQIKLQPSINTNLILSSSFKSELSQHNSLYKKQGLLSTRLLSSLRGKKVFFNLNPEGGNNFNKKISNYSQSNGSDKEDKNLDRPSENSNLYSEHSAKVISNSQSNSDTINIKEAANELFENIFLAQYEKNQQQKDENNQSFITKEQFEDAIYIVTGQQFEGDDDEAQDQANNLLKLYNKADPINNGMILKQHLIESIQSDIQIQFYGSVNQSPDPVKSKDKQFSTEEQLQESTNRKLLIQESGKYDTDSPNKNHKDISKFNFNSPEVRRFDEDGKALRDNQQTVFKNPGLNFQLKIDEMSSGSDALVENEHIQEFTTDSKQELSSRKQNLQKRQSLILQNTLSGSQLKQDQPTPKKDNYLRTTEFDIDINENIISGKGSCGLSSDNQHFKNIRMDQINDGTLQQIKSQNENDKLTGINRCNQMIETLQYIQQNKLTEYSNDTQSMDTLLHLIIESFDILIKSQQIQNEQIEEYETIGSKEIQQYQEANIELENELDNLECELDKMKKYETSYHTQEKRLRAELDRVDQITMDKENIETVHQDLIQEYNNLKLQNEKLLITNRQCMVAVEELENTVSNLKAQIIKRYEDPDDTDGKDEQDDIHLMQVAQDQVQSQQIDNQNQEFKANEGELQNNIAAQQDIPSEIDLMMPKENLNEFKTSIEQIEVEKILEEQEEQLLIQLETTNEYQLKELKEEIKNYVYNNVQLNRQGQKVMLKKAVDKIKTVENKMRKRLIQIKFQNDQLFSDLKKARFGMTQFENQCEEKQREIEDLKVKLRTMIEETMNLNQEKVRIMGVNKILEQKIQVQGSEMMTLQSDVDNVMRFGGGESMYSGNQKGQRKMGQMSSYIRKNQNAIRSSKGSSRSRGQDSLAFGQKKDFDKESYNQRMYIKMQNRKQGDASQYVDDKGSMYSGFSQSQNSKIVFDQSNYSRSIRSRRIMNKIGNKSLRGSTNGSVRSGSVYSGVGRAGERIQQINAISSQDSDDQSMGSMTGENVFELNKDIEALNMENLKVKRDTNVYDLIGLADSAHHLYERINAVLEQSMANQALNSGIKGKQSKFVALKDLEQKSFFSESIKVYMDKMLKETILVIVEGLIYLISVGDTIKSSRLLIQPFNFLDDVQKIIFSEQQENYLALRLRDMRKTQGNRDHVIFELKDRELFADFVMAYAEQEEDEIIFEANEEFSMIVNSTPVWFSFDDIERCKKQDIAKQFKSKDLTGFLEMKQSKAINYFKMMFSKNANWENRYFALQGTKLYIYQGQNYNKPIQTIDICEDVVIKEVHKSETNGKMFVFSLTSSKNKQTEYLSASSSINMENWIKAFKGIKEMYQNEKQKIIDKLKKDLNKNLVKRESVTSIFKSKQQELAVYPINQYNTLNHNNNISVISEQSGETYEKLSNNSAEQISPSKLNDSLIEPKEFNMSDLFQLEQTTMIQNKNKLPGINLQSSFSKDQKKIFENIQNRVAQLNCGHKQSIIFETENDHQSEDSGEFKSAKDDSDSGYSV